MITGIYRVWQQRKKHRQQRKVNRLLQQREQIVKTGWRICAEVETSRCTGINANGFRLIQVRLKILLRNDQCLTPLCYAFVPLHWNVKHSLKVQVQFLAGDLSQVIIKL